MAQGISRGAAGAARGLARALAITGASLMFAACGAQLGTGPTQFAAKQKPATTASVTPPTDGRSELQKATEYWGKAYAADPRDAQTALNYARNLKAMGEKQHAFAVLQQASAVHGTHRGINGEYGRLALEFEQVALAQKVLEQADDPANPDWRVISARGTVYAKQGKYREAIPLYERALALAPNQASILNNLALAQALDGHADKAEPLLKKAVAAGGFEERVNQNLALVLGLQGKYDEAKLTAGRTLPPDTASASIDYLQRIVKLEPKPMTPAAHAEAKLALGVRPQQPELKGAMAAARTSEGSGWTTQVAEAPNAPAR
ncbi:MAG: tetratricopeptide repeat protein [Hyphomicrobiaceae bacterium]|nr:MAG: tetratricopeptide repeat protein [Hyphomicrobiaceae bacterium]